MQREQDTGLFRFGPDGIQLEHLFLMELRQMSKSSFQPVFAYAPRDAAIVFDLKPTCLWSGQDARVQEGDMRYRQTVKLEGHANDGKYGHIGYDSDGYLPVGQNDTTFLHC